ncbi:hypothetical protein ACP4OV_013555 [Aristida adscensionis]
MVVAEEKTRNLVDICDVADALILVWRSPTSRKYICSAHDMKVSKVIGFIRRLRTDLKLNYPDKFSVQVEDERVVSSKRL